MLLRRSCWFVLGALAVAGCGDGGRPDWYQFSLDVQFQRIDGGYILPDGRIVYDDMPPAAETGAGDATTTDAGPRSDIVAVDAGGMDSALPPMDVVDAGAPPVDVPMMIEDRAMPAQDHVDVDMEDVERCTPGEMRRCPLAPGQIERTYMTGRCRRGNQSCNESGRWNPCEGQVEPIMEQSNNIDDNCNGLIDDIHQRCGNGACQIERLVCVLGRPVQCEPNFAARSVETCNGFDDDCDGMADEGDGDGGMLQESCFTYPPEYNGRGTCRSGTRTCERGTWGSCSDIIPQPEVCNGLDDDCDGTVDNNCRDN